MISLNGSRLTLDELLAIADGDAPVALAPDAASARRRGARRRRSAGARRHAGLRHQHRLRRAGRDARSPRDALGALQVNLLRSHAAGVGEPLPVRAVRASMALRANVLAKGFSGIRRATLERLIDLLNRRVHPRVPSRGSVGASGDLAPLAHLSLVLIGEGDAWVGDDRRLRPGRRRARGGRARRRSRSVRRKGSRSSTARSRPPPSRALAVAGAERLARAADIAAALSIDALRGSRPPVRSPHSRTPGRTPARWPRPRNIRRAARGSAINKSHEHCGRVQDAYSLRCAAQVHGAAREGPRVRPAAPA